MYVFDIFKSMFGFPTNNNRVSVYTYEDGGVESDGCAAPPTPYVDNGLPPFEEADLIAQIEQMFTDMDEIGKMFSDADEVGRMFGSIERGMHEGMRSERIEDERLADDTPLHRRMLKPQQQQQQQQQQQSDLEPPITHSHAPFSFGHSFGNIFGFAEEPTSPQRDSDLDGLVKTQRDYRAMFDKPEPSQNTISRIRVWSKISADGKVEERRTVDDGQGNRNETVSKTIGDQGYSIETKTDIEGSVEVKESYDNMTKDDKESFEHYWKQPSTDSRGRQFPEQLDPQTRTIFRNLFGDGFPGFGRN